MNTELLEALTILEKEKNISKDVMMEAIENSLLSACKNHFGTSDNIKIVMDRETCDYSVFAEKEVVEEVFDPAIEISLEDAEKINPSLHIGDIAQVPVYSKEFGRIATQNAKNLILQKIREEERKVVFDQYFEKEKDIVTGIVQRYVGKNISINLGRADAMLTENEQVKGEHFEPTERIKLYIVEVKNTSKNIFIDEEGNYYRTGEFLKWDCNIAEKMALKEELLRTTLKKVGIAHVQIRSVVVFTNNHVEVQNKYSQIRTCFVSQLAYIIDGFRMADTISEIEMDTIQVTIEAATNKESYPFDFDVLQYKVDFATLLVTLEFEKAKSEKADAIVGAVASKEVTKIQKYNISNWFKRAFASKQAKYAGSAAVVAVTIASSLIVSNIINKGGAQL